MIFRPFVVHVVVLVVNRKTVSVRNMKMYVPLSTIYIVEIERQENLTFLWNMVESENVI